MLDPSPELALRHTEALASLTVEALVDHPLELLIQHALDVAAAALGERAATLSESVPKTGTLDVREVVGLPDAEGLRCDADASNALGSCLSGRRPVLVSDWRCEERYEWPQALRRAGVHSTLAVPVLAGPWQGVLAVHSAAPGRFTSESVKPLEEVTRVLAAGLRRAHLEELVQSRAQQHAALAELGRLTLTDMPADELLGRGAELVAAAMGAAVVTVSGRDPDDSVHVRAVHPPDLASAESWLGDGASATVPDWSLADRGPAAPAEQSVRSSIAARTGPHGMLAVHFRDPHERDAVDARLVEVCASMLAGAVERSNAQRRMAMTAVTASVAADVAAASGTAVETRRRRAAASMLRAGEAERERIASELHDDTVQEMAAILITL
ncbi:MAG: GAF domain-containing protein, partial [Gaiellales bacterium]